MISASWTWTQARDRDKPWRDHEVYGGFLNAARTSLINEYKVCVYIYIHNNGMIYIYINTVYTYGIYILYIYILYIHIVYTYGIYILYTRIVYILCSHLILIGNIPIVVGELCWYCQNSIMIGQYPLGPPSFFDMFCWSY